MTSKLLAGAFGALMAISAHSTPLITFTDNAPSSVVTASLNDVSVNLAVSWTQTVASSNVTLSALLQENGGSAANWYVTTAVGAGTTAAQVVYSGTYLAPPPAGSTDLNFNGDPRTVLGAGLNFAAGTYFLVLDGPAGQFFNSAEWVGDFLSRLSINLASGYSVGGYMATLAPDPFAPGSTFSTAGLGRFGLVFELESVAQQVPVAPTLPLVALGLLALAVVRKREAM